MRIRASIQLAAEAPDASVGHLASGAVVRPDLVVVPNVDASVLRHVGPYVAVIVTQMEDALATWEMPDEVAGGERFAADGMSAHGILTVQWIICAPEEVHTVDPAQLQAGFRLAAPCDGPLGPVNVDRLLDTAQEQVWPEARAVLGAIPTALPNGVPRLGNTTKVVWHVSGTERPSWCRFVPWC